MAVLGVDAVLRGVDNYYTNLTARIMNPTDRVNLKPTQEKLEWVTPKISLMAAVETAGKADAQSETTVPSLAPLATKFGPS